MIPPCPICKKPVGDGPAPFCSKRCSDIDLGRWLKGNYAIPGPAIDESEGQPSRDDDDPQIDLS